MARLRRSAPDPWEFSMTLDHIGLTVSDYPRSKALFGTALAPLGITLVMEVEGWADGAFVIGPDGHNVEAVCHAAAA